MSRPGHGHTPGGHILCFFIARAMLSFSTIFGHLIRGMLACSLQARLLIHYPMELRMPVLIGTDTACCEYIIDINFASCDHRSNQHNHTWLLITLWKTSGHSRVGLRSVLSVVCVPLGSTGSFYNDIPSTYVMLPSFGARAYCHISSSSKHSNVFSSFFARGDS